jgi:hypothetical protein
MEHTAEPPAELSSNMFATEELALEKSSMLVPGPDLVRRSLH